MGALVAAIFLAFDGSDRTGLLFALLGVAWFTYLIPLSIWLNILLTRKSGVRHQVNFKGIRANRHLYQWPQVEKYNFSDDLLLPDVGRLYVKLRQSQQWTSLPFLRSEISKRELGSIMERFASPGAGRKSVELKAPRAGKDMKRLRERTDFPAADGWVEFENNSGRPLDVVMELWGIGGTIHVGEKAHVLIKPDCNSPATIIIHDDVIQIYCADAIYKNSKEVLDMTDE